MAVNIPGLIAVIVFYIIIFLVGILAAKIQAKKNRQQHIRGDEEVMLAGRNLGWFVGCFTMTGMTYSHMCIYNFGFLFAIVRFIGKPMRANAVTH